MDCRCLLGAFRKRIRFAFRSGFFIFLLISNVFHYIDPDRGLRQNNGETVFFGHFNSAYQKTFDQYDERDLWFWRLWGYIEQFFFLVIAVVLYFVIVSNHF